MQMEGCCRGPPFLRVSDIEFKNRFAARSIGHALPALGVVLLKYGRGGQEDATRNVHLLIAFFQNYIAAKQLHDDAHDWADDLLRGRMTPVLLGLLRSRAACGPTERVALKRELTDIFWQEHIVKIAEEINLHIKKSQEILSKIRVIKDPEPLLTILSPLRASAQRILEERKKTLKFLEIYRHQK